METHKTWIEFIGGARNWSGYRLRRGDQTHDGRGWRDTDRVGSLCIKGVKYRTSDPRPETVDVRASHKQLDALRAWFNAHPQEAPQIVATLFQIAACVLAVTRKALVVMGAPASVLAAHDDGDSDPVEQWIEAQPRRDLAAQATAETNSEDGGGSQSRDYWERSSRKNFDLLMEAYEALRRHELVDLPKGEQTALVEKLREHIEGPEDDREDPKEVGYPQWTAGRRQ